MSKRARPPQVEVEWEDTTSRGRWQTIEDTRASHKADPCTSSGYLVAKDKDKIVLALTVSVKDKDIDVLDTIAIPRGCVKAVHYLERKR